MGARIHLRSEGFIDRTCRYLRRIRILRAFRSGVDFVGQGPRSFAPSASFIAYFYVHASQNWNLSGIGGRNFTRFGKKIRLGLNVCWGWKRVFKPSLVLVSY